MSEDYKNLFPEQVVWKIAEPWMWETPACAEEEALIKKAVEKRKREFRAGRNCAHALLSSQGVDCPALLKGKQREPAWPKGWVGSISHTQGLCMVAIARTTDYESIGLDVEQASPLSDDVRELICSKEEQDEISKIQLLNPLQSSYDKLVFSAKESIHKTYFPLNYHTLDFLDARIKINTSDQSFIANIIKPEPNPIKEIKQLNGNYCFVGKYVATFIGLRATKAND